MSVVSDGRRGKGGYMDGRNERKRESDGVGG